MLPVADYMCFPESGKTSEDAFPIVCFSDSAKKIPPDIVLPVADYMCFPESGKPFSGSFSDSAKKPPDIVLPVADYMWAKL